MNSKKQTKTPITQQQKQNTAGKAQNAVAGPADFFNALNSMADMHNLYGNLDDNPPQQQQQNKNQNQHKQPTTNQPKTAVNTQANQKQNQQQIQKQVAQTTQPQKKQVEEEKKIEQPRPLNHSQIQRKNIQIINRKQVEQDPKFKQNLLNKLKGYKHYQQFISIIEKENEFLYLDHWNLLINSIYSDQNEQLLLFKFGMKDLDQVPSLTTILDQCAIANQQFVDTDFQPNQQSVGKPNTTYVWRRPKDFSQNYQLFSKITPESVVQGQLGDCYLISSMAVLSDNPDNIQRLIQSSETNDWGCYIVWICESGIWKKVILDDLFPCYNEKSKPAFTQPINNDIWSLLIEKAYAKTYGSYYNIESGFSADALKDLTGAPAEYIDLKDLEVAWKKLNFALHNNYVLTVSSKIDSQDVVSKHCYSIFNLREINLGQGRKQEYFIKIRNPYGNINAPNLTKLDQAYIKALGEDIQQPGGLLWLCMDDFVENFEVVTASRIRKNYFYSFIKYQNQFQTNCTNTVLYARVAQKSNCYFSIHQKHERFFKKNSKDKYQYATQRIIIAKLGNDGQIEKTINGNFNCMQSCYVEIDLERGDYIIFAEVDQTIQVINQYGFTVSCYSSHPVSLQNCSEIANFQKINEIQLLQYLIYNFVQNTPEGWQKKEYNAPNENSLVLRNYGSLFGYAFICYDNQMSNTTFFEQIQEFVQLENLTAYIPKDIKNIQVQLNPGQFEIILFKIGHFNNCSHKMSFKSVSNFIAAQSNNVESLINQTIQQGAQKKRNNGKNDIDVIIYTLKYNGGFFIVYKNNLKSVYQESLTFKVLDNLVITCQNDCNKNKDISIKIQPNDTFWIHLKFKNPSNTASKYTCSYVIGL